VVAELKGDLNEKARRRMTVTFQDPGAETWARSRRSRSRVAIP
jgi:hypothetical protein